VTATDRPQSWPFDAVLIANRGEIAARVVRTVQRLGMNAAVVYHSSDRETLAVRMADQAVEITSTPPVAAYLDAAQILSVAKASSCGAIHPGYGFLSEKRCVRACGRDGWPGLHRSHARTDRAHGRQGGARAGSLSAPVFQWHRARSRMKTRQPLRTGRGVSARLC